MKIIKLIHTLLFLSLLPGFALGAEEDSLSVKPMSVYANPAFNFYRYSSSQSKVQLKYVYDDKDAYIEQLGSGENAVEFQASSWMSLNKNNKIWGKAMYRSTNRKAVKWNEASDYEMLYPYVMADSVGGDLAGQTYYFDGGYAARKQRLTWGVGISYRAMIEYRDVDPRPRNIVSDLNVNAGVAWSFPHYILGATAAYSSYNQKNDVDFYSQLGQAFMYTMTGLGNTYSRFNGNRTSAEYRGDIFKVSAQVKPLENDGLWLNADYKLEKMTRYLLTEGNIPLTVMNENNYSLSAAWLDSFNGNSKWGINVSARQIKRTGKENLFDSGNGNAMEIIGNRNSYKENKGLYSASLIFSTSPVRNYRFSLSPSVNMLDVKMSHIDNDRKIKYTYMTYGGRMSNYISMKKWSLDISASAFYQTSQSAEISINGIENDEIRDMLTRNYEVLTTDRWMSSLSFTADIPLSSNKLSLIAGIDGKRVMFKNNLGNNNYLEMNIGIRF